MVATYYFLQAPDGDEVPRWFREQPERTDEFPKGEGTLLYFSQCGGLTVGDNGEVDVARSPVVSLVSPQIRRQALWTVGEVHFLAEKASTTFPPLEALRKRFHVWLGKQAKVWDQANQSDGFGHFLEGSVRNIARQAFALPSGLAAIEAGQYFVAHDDNDEMLDRVCKSLRLRGVECA